MRRIEYNNLLLYLECEIYSCTQIVSSIQNYWQHEILLIGRYNDELFAQCNVISANIE